MTLQPLLSISELASMVPYLPKICYLLGVFCIGLGNFYAIGKNKIKKDFDALEKSCENVITFLTESKNLFCFAWLLDDCHC